MNSIHGSKVGANFEASLDAVAGANIGQIQMKSIYHFECFGPDGVLKWEETVENLVVDAGLNDLLDKYFKGSSYTATWYVGLKDTGSVVAGDTMASHGGWAELTIYSNANRPTLTLGSVSGKSVDNSASKAQFNINSPDDVYGAFICTDDTKGGTSGTLYGAADFSSARGVGDGDTLNVTVTLTSAAA